MALNLVIRGHCQVAFDQSYDWQQMVLDSARGHSLLLSYKQKARNVMDLGRVLGPPHHLSEKGTVRSEPLHLHFIGIDQRPEAESSWPAGPLRGAQEAQGNRTFSE